MASSFWATLCKRFTLCYRTVVCLSVLFCLYCGQMVGWIKMKLGTQVGLGPGHIVLDWDPALPSPKREQSPLIFGPCLLWLNSCMDQDTTWYGGSPRPRPHFAIGTHLPSPKRGHSGLNFRPMSTVPKRLDESWCHLVWRWCQDGDFLTTFCVLYLQRAPCSTFQTCILNSHLGHTMCASMVDIHSMTAEIRRGKKKKKKIERNHRAKI